MGAIYFTMKNTNEYNLLLCNPSLVSSLRLRALPSFQPTKITIKTPPNGRRIFEAKKSIISKKNMLSFPAILSILMALKVLHESVQNMPKTVMAIADVAVAHTLFILNSSTKYATTTSNKEIDDVNAAITISRKKIMAKKLPNGICSKMEGIVIKTNPGPLSGAIPKANTAGKIIKPAKIAIKKSVPATLTAIPPNFSFFLKYEL